MSPVLEVAHPERSLAPARISLSDALFTDTQQRVLGVLFGQPHRSFYAREVIGLTRGGSGAVQRELSRLARSELVTVRRVGNQTHYQANTSSPIYAELRGIVSKTVGLAEPLRQALAPLTPKLRAAFVFGSVAKRQDTATSDIDLMLISDDLTYADVFASLESEGERLGRKINPTIYTPADMTQRIARGDPFITRVIAQPKIWIVGGEDVIGV